MAKKSAAPPLWESSLTCPRRGCGKVHKVCLEAAKAPASDDWLVYRCPTTNQAAGVRYGDLKWRAVATRPKDAIPILPPAKD